MRTVRRSEVAYDTDSVCRAKPIGVARPFMIERNVHHLRVVDDHELVGEITDGDIKLVLGLEFDYPDPKTLIDENAMVENAYVVGHSTRQDVWEAACPGNGDSARKISGNIQRKRRVSRAFDVVEARVSRSRWRFRCSLALRE